MKVFMLKKPTPALVKIRVKGKVGQTIVHDLPVSKLEWGGTYGATEILVIDNFNPTIRGLWNWHQLEL